MVNRCRIVGDQTKQRQDRRRHRTDREASSVGLFGQLWRGGKKSGTAQPVVQTFELACPDCGATIQGRRHESYQAIRCPVCRGGVFVLPRSPFAEPPPPPFREPTRVLAGPVAPMMSGTPDDRFRAVDDPVVPDIAWTEAERAFEPTPDPSRDRSADLAVVEDEPLEIVWTDEQEDPAPPPPPKPPARPRSTRTASTHAAPSPPPTSQPPSPASPPAAKKGKSAAPTAPLPSVDRLNTAQGRPRQDTPPAQPFTEADQRITWSEWVQTRRRVLIMLAVVGFVGVTIWQNLRQARLEEYPRIVAEGYERGIPALEAGQFDLAKQLLADALRAVEGLGGQVEHAAEIRQAAREAFLYADLCRESLETVLDEAARSDPVEWPIRFRRLYQGQAVVLEATVEEEPTLGGISIDDRIFTGPGPRPQRVGRFVLADLNAFRDLKPAPRPGDRLRFGARLQSLTLDPDTNEWFIRFEPNSGVFLTHTRALEVLGWPGPNRDPIIPITPAGDRDIPAGEDSLIGLSRGHVLGLLGKPERVQLRATQGLLIENWVYRRGNQTQTVVFQSRAGNAQPVVKARYVRP